MKTRALPALLAVLLSGALLSACTSPQRRPRLPLKLDANPSALLALEIAMKQLSKEKGRSEALREFAAPDAVMFVPQRVAAASWLKDNRNLPAIDWDVHRVITSCDGKAAVTTGAWRAQGNSRGYFTTIWQRFEQPDGTGKWLWTLTHDDRLEEPWPAPDFVRTDIASCKGRASVAIAAPAEGTELKQGLSRDQSLSWTWQYRADQSRSLEIKIWDGAKIITLFTNNVPAK